MKKKGLITLFSLFAVVIVGLLVGVIVLASQTQNLNSNISISYTATEISGGVSATYKIGDGEEKDMIVDGNESELVATFDADLNSTTQGLSPTESQLVLLAKQDLIFTYTFFNRGDYPYYATLNYTDSNNDDANIDVYYKSASDAEFSMDNATQIQVPAMVGEAVGTTTYQVKMTIHDSSFDSKMSGVFNWNLSKEKPLNISLAYTNNTDSAINPENVTIVANEDKTQFKIVGPTPIVADNSTTNLTELTNASGSEFYYFASNSEVKDSTGYTDPGTTYYISPYSSSEETASSMYTYGQGLQNMSATMASDPSQYTANEVWYDMPAKPTIIYATFMTPNNRTGDASSGDAGNVVISHSVYSIPENAFKSSSLTSCVVPNSITSIGESAFYECENVTAIILPETLNFLGDGVFYGCSNLTYLKIPKGVKNIGIMVFAGCFGLTDITIPEGVTRIEYMAFAMTGLRNIIIPDGVTNIGDGAFFYCGNLTSITIPEGVTSIGVRAFYYCSSLTSITIPESMISIGNEAFAECTSLNYNILDNVKYLGSTNNPYMIVMGVTDTTLTSYTISDNTKYLYQNAFSDCTNLTTISIPNSVTSMNGAFSDCTNLTTISIPNSVTSMNGAFYNCDKLNYNILDSVKYLGNDSNPYLIVMGVTDKTLTSYTISNNAKIIYDDAFEGCSNLLNITIPDSVTSIGYGAFDSCSSLTSVTIGSGVTYIGHGAFNECTNLTRVNIKNLAKWCEISFIFDAASGYTTANPLYYAKNLYLNDVLITNLVIPSETTQIKDYAFYYCSSLTSVTIPDSVTHIGFDAFDHCVGLTSISIGNGVASLRGDAFYSCSENLESITVSSENTKYSGAGNCLIDTSTKTLILGCKNSIIPTDGSVTSIGGNAFRNCSNLTSITIPNSVTSIGDSAFNNCRSLTSVTIPNSVTSIGDSAFNNCRSLTSVTIGSGITSIGRSAFQYCYKLVELYNLSSLNIAVGGGSADSYVGSYAKVIHTSLSEESIIKEVDDYQYYAYSGEYGLLAYKGTATELTLPANLEDNNYSIYQCAFYGCSTLTSVTIPDSVTSIKQYAFENCSSLTDLTVGSGVTSIGSFAFSNCNNLTKVNITDIANWCSITFNSSSESNPLYYAHNLYLNDTLVTDLVIPSEVTVLGGYSFHYCTSLTSVIIPDSVTSISDREAFAYCTNLTSVIIGNGLASLPYGTFIGCSSLTSVTIGSGLTDIGSHCFAGCSSLTSITIPEKVTLIRANAFSNCGNLTSITIENTTGWKISNSMSFSSYSSLSSTNLSDTSTAATYLTSTYYDKYWKRG